MKIACRTLRSILTATMLLGASACGASDAPSGQSVDPSSSSVIGSVEQAAVVSVFRYADAVKSSGGQFGASYAPANLINNGFTSPSNTINTMVNYLAAGNNYASQSGVLSGFDITFDFNQATTLDGLRVWNYVYRNTTALQVTNTSGVKDYTLTFYSGAGGTGSVVGTAFNGILNKATDNALNAAQVVSFGTKYSGVRSVVMRVKSNHGSTVFTGMNEVGFSEVPKLSAPAFVQSPSGVTFSWEVSGSISSLSLVSNGATVATLPLTATGSVTLARPVGEKTYTLMQNGVAQRSVSVVGLPSKDKVYLYLLLGQSNMQGIGSPFDATLDAASPRVVKFGSRDGMESAFVKGGHPLVGLGSEGGSVGMGVEFGKTVIAAQTDPEVVVGLINHALPSTAIQWWAPGVTDDKQANPKTGLNYKLYDEAVQRVRAAQTYGVLKGVLWHQGEYNSQDNTNPSPDPAGYAARLSALVSNLRSSFALPNLPFVDGKLVPASWVDDNGNTVVFSGLPYRSTVESALLNLPNVSPSTFAVDNNGLRGMTNNLIHFDAASQRELGRRYAAALRTTYTP